MTDILKSILKALDDASVPSELRSVAFGKAFDYLAGQPRVGGPGLGAPTQPAPSGSAAAVASIANKLKLENDVVREVFSVDGEKIQLVIPAGKLEKTKSGATRQICLLLAAARQAAGVDEEWTSSGTVREACVDYGRYDSPNFASAIQGLDDLVNIRGKGQQREVRVNRRGYEEAATLVRRLAGVDA
jgi:hypothetical protein